jgi:hypothetical protein
MDDGWRVEGDWRWAVGKMTSKWAKCGSLTGLSDLTPTHPIPDFLVGYRVDTRAPDTRGMTI